jgi:integrase
MGEKKPSNKFPFTQNRLEKLAPPPSGRVYFYDTATPGLALCVTAAGAKTFYSVRKINGRNGKTIRMLLGKFPGVTLDAASKAALKIVGDIAKGIDPSLERNAKREEPTLANLWDSYLELHAKPQKKSWKDDERQYNKYLPTLRNKRLSAITKTVVTKWHSTIAKEHGPIQANRCKALLATMFSKASATVGYTGSNPAKGVANFPERSRERFLLPAEMKAFFTALAAEDAYWQAFFLLCLFTGSRRGNVASMAWAEIDLENSVWHIPASKTKNKRPTTVSLCAPALAILRTRHDQRNRSPYVFPAFTGDGHMIDPRKAWNRVLTAMRTCPECEEVIGQGELVDQKAWKRADRKYRCPKCKAELPDAKPADLHMHDLRRTQDSWQAAMGISLAIIGKSLGHADLKSMQVYALLQLDPVKDAVSRSAGAMLEAANISLASDGTVKSLDAIPMQPKVVDSSTP